MELKQDRGAKERQQLFLADQRERTAFNTMHSLLNLRLDLDALIRNGATRAFFTKDIKFYFNRCMGEELYKTAVVLQTLWNLLYKNTPDPRKLVVLSNALQRVIRIEVEPYWEQRRARLVQLKREIAQAREK